MPRNLSLSISARNNKGVTRYERERERSCTSINKDHGWFVVGASGSESGPSGRERPRSGKDVREVEVSEWWMWLRTEDVFGTEDSSVVARGGEDSGVASGSRGFLRGKLLVAWARVIILMRVKFWPLQMPPASPPARVCEREVGEVKIFGWIVNAFKIHYDACRQSSNWRIFSDHYGSSRINYGLHSWMPVATSDDWISQELSLASFWIMVSWLRL